MISSKQFITVLNGELGQSRFHKSYSTYTYFDALKNSSTIAKHVGYFYSMYIAVVRNLF